MGTIQPATTFTQLTETDAREVVAWHYPPPYDCYDSPPWDEVVEQGWAITDPTARATQFTAMRTPDGRLVGFLRLRVAGEPPSVLLSCGLHPAWCGRGLGRSLVAHAVERTASEHPGSDLALDVRPFNTRAIRLYAGSGFTAHGQATDAPTPLIRMIRRGR